MQIPDDASVIVCFRTNRLPIPNLSARPTLWQCHTCRARIWLSKVTQEKAEQQEPRRLVFAICSECAEEMMKTIEKNGVNWVLTEDQADLASLLPPGGPGGYSFQDLFDDLT